jgi:hypothetical protein
LFFHVFGNLSGFFRERLCQPRGLQCAKSEIFLRPRLSAGLSIRAISASTKVSVGAIQKLLSQTQSLQLDWPLPPDLDDSQLAQLFYPDADTRVSSRDQIPGWSAR